MRQVFGYIDEKRIDRFRRVVAQEKGFTAGFVAYKLDRSRISLDACDRFSER